MKIAAIEASAQISAVVPSIKSSWSKLILIRISPHPLRSRIELKSGRLRFGESHCGPHGISNSVRAILAASTLCFGCERGAPVEWEDEEAWLRARIIRLRRLLRLVKDTQVEAGLKEFIGEAEARLDRLQRRRMEPVEDEPPGG